MQAKNRVILEIAIGQGVKRGYRRAYKHVENPTEEAVCFSIEEQVMESIYEYFRFDEND
jgi:hypothetical protein